MKRFDKQVDLRRSEWSRVNQREPVFGPNVAVLGWFVFYLVGGLIVGKSVAFIVDTAVAVLWP